MVHRYKLSQQADRINWNIFILKSIDSKDHNDIECVANDKEITEECIHNAECDQRMKTFLNQY